MRNDPRLILPEFPHTAHLPWKPNPGKDDTIAEQKEMEVLEYGEVYVEEKIDGSSVGVNAYDEVPIVRNRDHILQKGYMRKKHDTTAKMQFRPLWGWVYENMKKFAKLYEEHGNLSVYGQWMYAQHGMYYDALPDWFIAHDLYDVQARRFLRPSLTRVYLQRAGFSIPALQWIGGDKKAGIVIPTPEDYIRTSNLPSAFSTTELAEGIYVKVGDDKWTTHRFKMVREGFVQGRLWSDSEIKKNKCR